MVQIPIWLLRLRLDRLEFNVDGDICRRIAIIGLLALPREKYAHNHEVRELEKLAAALTPYTELALKIYMQTFSFCCSGEGSLWYPRTLVAVLCSAPLFQAE